MLPHFVDFETLPWIAPAPGVRYKAYQQDGRRMRLLEFTPDFVETEWCIMGHIGYVLAGELEIAFDPEVYTYRPGMPTLSPRARRTATRLDRFQM